MPPSKQEKGLPMHRRVAALTVWLFGLIALIAPVLAQPGRGGSLSLEGRQLPVVKAFDETGQVFTTASLKGSYTVLVFGCLT